MLMKCKNDFPQCVFCYYLQYLRKHKPQPPQAGGEATGSGGSVSYSVGQVVYTTNTGINGSVAQGVQQPYEFQM
jgi:hypothetical protein